MSVKLFSFHVVRFHKNNGNIGDSRFDGIIFYSDSEVAAPLGVESFDFNVSYSELELTPFSR